MAENPFPPLDDFDLERLDESIRDHGVQEPIVEDEFGKLIDGFTRKGIAEKYGISCPVRVVSGLTEPEKYELAIMLNAARRHLTIDQKRHVWRQRRARIEVALVADPTRSDRAIAEETGTTHPTVAAVREHLESGGKLSTAPYKPGGAGGGGVREVREDAPAENNADHRNEVWVRQTIGYPCVSDDSRRRGEDPYPAASDRLEWPSGQIWLSSPPPTNDAEFMALQVEIARRMQKISVEQPLKTMTRKQSIYA